ncbi:MAG TPA: ABC transporter substrate-binding protein [Smithellaceae bacterium]|nr:ABC transporter substrate-binding protein [Smithellaceae bacterium]
MKKLKALLCSVFAFAVLAGAQTVFADEIVVGYTGPLSGPAAEYGQDCMYGLDMAVKELNAAGGVTVKGKKYTFRMERLDDRADPTQAKNNALRFVNQNKAIAVFNPMITTLASIMSIPQTPGNEFIIAGYTSIHTIMRQGHPMIINAVSDFTVYAQNMAEQGRARGWKKLAMVVTMGGYGDAWRKAFSAIWAAKGGSIVGDYPANYYVDTDFSSQLTAAMSKRPDALLIGGPSATTALVIEQARGMGFRGGFILIDQAKPDYVARVLKNMKLLEGMISTGAIAALPLPAGEPFNNRFRAAYKREMTAECVLHYNVMKVIAKTIAITNSINPVDIRRNLHKALPTSGDQVPNELFGIDDNGNFYCGLVMQTVKDGKFSKVDYLLTFPKTQAEFEKYKKMSKSAEPEMIRWAPLQ